MPILWLDIPDHLLRGAMERDLIALLSNAGRTPVAPPSDAAASSGSLATALRNQ